MPLAVDVFRTNNNNSNNNNNNNNRGYNPVASSPSTKYYNDDNDDDAIPIEFNATFLLVIMLLSILWFLCISISTANNHVEAFTRNLQKRLSWLQQQSIETTTRSFSSQHSAFLKDLSPPFSINVGDDDDDDDNISTTITYPDVTHFCFLIHGHRGLSKDLMYMQTVMQRWAAVEKKKKQRSSSSSLNSDIATTTTTTANEEESMLLMNATTMMDPNVTSSSSSAESLQSPLPEEEEKEEILLKCPHDLVVHNAVCNEGKTTDGVENGGNRLVDEIRQVIAREVKLRHPEDDDDDNNHNDDDGAKTMSYYDVTLSLLGNSLGGLFGRYAIAELIARHCTKEDATNENSCWILDGKYRLHLNIFCTTATPHLGISRHTYLPVPRMAEIGVAKVLGDTGRDLFRLNDLLHTMATSPKFLEPLAKFRKRIAYANAYGTDFPVPAGTAAFLSENSTYPHLFEEEDLMVDDSGYIIATLHTPPEKRGRELKFGNDDDDDTEDDDGTPETTFAEVPTIDDDDDDDDDESLLMNKSNNNNNNNNATDDATKSDVDREEELHQMSLSLDKLGWKKVFVDIRRAIPSIEIPMSLRMRRQDSPSRLVVDGNNNNNNNNNTKNACLNSLKETRSTVESRDIASAVYSQPDNRLALPLGHNAIIAFSRSRMSTYMNKGGRPVVDALAKELVEDIFTWSGDNDEASSSSAAMGGSSNSNTAEVETVER